MCVVITSLQIAGEEDVALPQAQSLSAALAGQGIVRARPMVQHRFSRRVFHLCMRISQVVSVEALLVLNRKLKIEAIARGSATS